MKKINRTKFIHEGEYAAEVPVVLIETDDEWSPYLSVEDAYKLDDVREALRRGDVSVAARHARICLISPACSSAICSRKSLISVRSAPCRA